VQAIGGANHKIEGFFDVCKARGLTGNEGVLIPASNVPNLMLREDVVQAVQEGQFSIYAVSHVEEGIEILTGVPAGKLQEDGTYPEGTVNALVTERLRSMAEQLRSFGRDEEKDEGKQGHSNPSSAEQEA